MQYGIYNSRKNLLKKDVKEVSILNCVMEGIMELGEKIKSERVKRSVSQKELAEQLRVSRQTISNWENDRTIPDTENLITRSS